MNSKKIVFFFLYTLFIIFFTVLSLEILLKFYFQSQKIPTDNKNNFRYMLYSEGKLFKSDKNFFKYYSNLNKRSLQFYYQNGKFIKIWDYNFPTNNFGLVQSTDIDPSKKSILFLGDSFTEGLGAPPWVDSFNGNFLGYQTVNGGIAGTGFQQFENIYDHIKENYDIEKIVVLYIGGDVRRRVSLASTTKCLLDNKFCKDGFGVYSIPKDESKINEFLKKKHQLRQNSKKTFKKKIKFLIRDTYTYNILRSQINNFRLTNDKVIKNNLQSIEDLYNENKKKIIFINLKTVEEIILKKNTYETELLKKFFIKKKIPNYKCDMNNDISNFHPIDFHPNRKGYNEIYLCVREILENYYNK